MVEALSLDGRPSVRNLSQTEIFADCIGVWLVELSCWLCNSDVRFPLFVRAIGCFLPSGPKLAPEK